MLTSLPLYALFGGLVGLLAGLTGAGGAVLLVPIMHFALSRQGVDPEVVHHMALATTMANILFTSSMVTYQQHRRGTVPWKTVAWMVPGLLAGSFAGSYATGYIAARPLILAFGGLLTYSGIQMLVEIRPNASRHMPGKAGQILIGFGIGAFSGFLGIGGVTLSIPILLFCGMGLLPAIATAGAFGFPIAVTGCIGYFFAAQGASGLPAHALGYIYLPALLGFIPASLLLAPVGVRLSHTLPPRLIRKGLGCLVLFMAYRMISAVL